eukprot:TRINITY_DN22475_c0_g1_i1.p1 TRINITY_DN22475_c0_g1~~TRINITY_DN22475_c0_g1_i1.p1  ORF type:complete len:587 (+),score=30.63 TRINITY_DN22475_c0_g1_i1:237-1997(+)
MEKAEVEQLQQVEQTSSYNMTALSSLNSPAPLEVQRPSQCNGIEMLNIDMINAEQRSFLETPPRISSELHGLEAGGAASAGSLTHSIYSAPVDIPDIPPLGLEPPHYMTNDESYELPRPDGGTVNLEALDTLRCIASTQLVLCNFYRGEGPLKGDRFAAWLSVWTQFLFMLSAFLLAYVEMVTPPHIRKSLSTLMYVRRRLTAVYPVYMFSLLVTLLTASPSSEQLTSEWPSLCLHVMLAQSWNPACSAGESCVPNMLNKDAWFLSILVQCWFILRPLASFFKRRSYRFCSITIVACWLFAFFLQWTEHDDTLAIAIGCEKGSVCARTLTAQLCASPLGYIHVFVSGVAAARVFIFGTMLDSTARSRSTVWSSFATAQGESVSYELRFGCCVGFAIFVSIVCIASDAVQRHYYFFNHGGLIPVMILIMIGAAIRQDPLAVLLFRWRPVIALGRISYIQLIMQRLVWQWMQDTFGWNIISKLGFMPVLTACSYMCYRYIERPFTQYQLLRQERGIRGCDERCINTFDSFMAMICCRCCLCLVPFLIVVVVLVLYVPLPFSSIEIDWPFHVEFNISSAPFRWRLAEPK